MFKQTQLMDENKIRYKYSNDDPWSPKLAQAYIMVQLWSVIKHQIPKKIQQINENTNIQGEIVSSLHTIPNEIGTVKNN